MNSVIERLSNKMPKYRHGSEPAGYAGGAAGKVDTYLREKYMKLQEGYLAVIPEDKSYVARVQRSSLSSPTKSITDRLGINDESKYKSKEPSILDELVAKRDYLTRLHYQ